MENESESGPSPTPPPTPQPEGIDHFFNKTGTSFSPYPFVPALGLGTMTEADEKLWAMFSHIGAVIGLGFIAPLVVYLMQKEQSPFVAAHAKESLNFQITALIFAVICIALSWLVIPFFIFMAYSVLMIVAIIVGGIRAHEGKFVAMPFSIRFLR